MTPLRIFIGYDPREAVAYHVLSHSIQTRASSPVSITPIMRSQFNGLYTRERGPTESTEFSLTRFLVPHFSDYRGVAIYMDPDMLCLTDITKVMDEIEKDPDKAVYVCKHEYTPKGKTKFLGQQQTQYARKNWSSFIVFNMRSFGCRRLDPGYINRESGLDLHQFRWIEDERIGGLPLEWNWLVGEYPQSPEAKIVHYTLGGPWLGNVFGPDYELEWQHELDQVFTPEISRE